MSDVKKIGRQLERMKGPSCQIKKQHRFGGRGLRDEGADDSWMVLSAEAAGQEGG